MMIHGALNARNTHTTRESNEEQRELVSLACVTLTREWVGADLREHPLFDQVCPIPAIKAPKYIKNDILPHFTPFN